MGILIGMDEAGYGPNYGPLVVAATAWEVPDEEPAPARALTLASGASPNSLPTTVAPLPTHSALRTPHSFPDLYRLLRTVVAKKSSDRRIAIADSKTLYAPGLGLRQLERGLHAVFSTFNQPPSCWSAVVDHCGADPDGHHKTTCWPEGFDCQLPIDAAADELPRLADRFARACETAGVRPIAIRARLVYAAQFNDLVDQHGTKGAALSHITVALLRDVIDTRKPSPSGRGQGEGAFSPASSPQPPAPVFAVCDKHGGRNFYAALLQHHFSEHWIEPIHESRVESRYEWGPPESRTCVAFRMKGERFLPTALASMTAKYLRELSMRAFNEFWAAHIPEIRPTAGYPNDARRFRKDIAAKQRELKIDDRVIWRNR